MVRVLTFASCELVTSTQLEILSIKKQREDINSHLFVATKINFLNLSFFEPGKGGVEDFKVIAVAEGIAELVLFEPLVIGNLAVLNSDLAGVGLGKKNDNLFLNVSH